VPPQPPPASPRFLTLDQMADELNTSRSQVYALVRDRSIIAVKIGGRGQWRVERAQLVEVGQGLLVCGSTPPTMLRLRRWEPTSTLACTRTSRPSWRAKEEGAATPP